MTPHNLQIYVKSQAIAAEVAGMEAENMQRAQEGNSMAYTEESFYACADALVILAKEITHDNSY